MKIYIFLLIGLLLTSCAQKTVNIDLQTIRLDQFLEKVKKTQNSVNSVKGLASVSIKTPETSISFTQVTVVEKPNLLRLEALTPFGGTAGIIASDGEKIYVLLPEQREVFDSLEEFNLSYLYPGLPPEMTVMNLVNLLLGRLPEESVYENVPTHISVESEKIILTFASDEKGKTVLRINPENHRIEKAELQVEGIGRVTCRFREFIDIRADITIPKRIELESEEFSISLNYSPDVEVNSDIERLLFNPSPVVGRFEKKH